MTEMYWEVWHEPTGNLLADFDTEEEAIAYILELDDPGLKPHLVIRDDWLYDRLTLEP